MEKKNNRGRGFGGELYFDEDGNERFIPHSNMPGDAKEHECCGSVQFNPFVSGTPIFITKDPLVNKSYGLSAETHVDEKFIPLTYSEVYGEGRVDLELLREHLRIDNAENTFEDVYKKAYDAQTGVFVGEYTNREVTDPDDELMNELTNSTHIPIQFKDGTRAVIIACGGGHIGRDGRRHIFNAEEFKKILELTEEAQVKIDASIFDERRKSMIDDGAYITTSFIDDVSSEFTKPPAMLNVDQLQCPRWKNPNVIPNSKADRKFDNQWKRNKKKGRKR